MKSPKCPNCGVETVARHTDNGCVLHALIGVIRDRVDLSERAIRKLHARCDADALWNDVAEIVDKLEAGDYSL